MAVGRAVPAFTFIPVQMEVPPRRPREFRCSRISTGCQHPHTTQHCQKRGTECRDRCYPLVRCRPRRHRTGCGRMCSKPKLSRCTTSCVAARCPASAPLAWAPASAPALPALALALAALASPPPLASPTLQRRSTRCRRRPTSSDCSSSSRARQLLCAPTISSASHVRRTHAPHAPHAPHTRAVCFEPARSGKARHFALSLN